MISNVGAVFNRLLHGSTSTLVVQTLKPMNVQLKMQEQILSRRSLFLYEFLELTNVTKQRISSQRSTQYFPLLKIFRQVEFKRLLNKNKLTDRYEIASVSI